MMQAPSTERGGSEAPASSADDASAGTSSSDAGTSAGGRGGAGGPSEARAGAAARSSAKAGAPSPSDGEAGTGGFGPATSAGAGHGGAGGEGASPSVGSQAPDCDLTGIWIAKQVTVSEGLSLPQSSNNWLYLELKQTGSSVEVTKHFDCGIEVRGSATVTLSRATLEALMVVNVETGRKASVQKDGDKCSFETGRFWSIRGADEARFLPNAQRDSSDSVRSVAAANPLPKPGNTDGAIDSDGDGKLGVAFQVAGVISGTRNAVQRDWSRWFTEPGYEIPASTNWTSDLKIRTDFDNEESVLDPTSGLLVTGSTPKTQAKHLLRLRFLGRDASDPRAASMVKASDVDTCYAIQDAFPAEELE